MIGTGDDPVAVSTASIQGVPRRSQIHSGPRLSLDALYATRNDGRRQLLGVRDEIPRIHAADDMVDGNMQSDSIFSRIIAVDAAGSFVCRDDTVSAFMDVEPIQPGHVLVGPNVEVRSLVDLDPEVGAHMFRIAQAVTKALLARPFCEGVNLILAVGEAAGQTVPHVHLHVVPRSASGFRFKMPNDHPRRPSRGDLDTEADTVRRALPPNLGGQIP